MIDKSCPHCTQLHRSNATPYGSMEPSFETTVSRPSHARRKDRSPTKMSDELMISTSSNGTAVSAGLCHRSTTSACISTKSVHHKRATDQRQHYTIPAESPPDRCSDQRASIPYDCQPCSDDSIHITNQTSALTLFRRLSDRIGCAQAMAVSGSVQPVEKAGEVQQDCRCYCSDDSISNDMASSSTKLKLKKTRLRRNSNDGSVPVVSTRTIRTALFGTPLVFCVALVIGLQLIASMRGVSAATSDISLLRHIREASNVVANNTPIIPRTEENGSKYPISFTICFFSLEHG